MKILLLFIVKSNLIRLKADWITIKFGVLLAYVWYIVSRRHTKFHYYISLNKIDGEFVGMSNRATDTSSKPH